MKGRLHPPSYYGAIVREKLVEQKIRDNYRKTGKRPTVSEFITIKTNAHYTPQNLVIS